jgi:hypothetical protein
VSQRDPFEDYRRRREVELMEHDFQKTAGEKRERLEKLLSESGELAELEERVTDEMQDFLADSTKAAEKMLERLHEDEGETGESHAELKAELQNFLKGAQAAQAAPSAAAPAAAPAPAPEANKPPDLRAALDRIRKHGGGDGAPAPSESPPPAAEPPAAAPRSPEEILQSFDATYQQVSDLLNRRTSSRDEPPAGHKLPGLSETVQRDRPRETPRAASAPAAPPAAPPAEPPPAAAPPAQEAPVNPFEPETTKFKAPTLPPSGGEGGGAGGATNHFAAEPEEDRDIDDNPDQEPEGWNLPERKPPPGAWVVERQKEEGEAGMAGMAGDTYLLKKLSQEVRRLNRLYLVLLEKKVVTRDEVEGPGADGKILVDKGAAPRASSDHDDDCASVDDYEEDRYRPILTNEKEFSLSTLVKDVHRLKTLRTVLVKKGVVSEKELSKVKS